MKARMKKFKYGGKHTDPSPFAGANPNTLAAVQGAFNQSLADPTTATERFDRDFQPATGEIEPDPSTDLFIGGLAAKGITAGVKGVQAGVQGIRNARIGKKALDRANLASDYYNNVAPLIRSGVLTEKTAEKLFLKSFPVKKEGGKIQSFENIANRF